MLLYIIVLKDTFFSYLKAQLTITMSTTEAELLALAYVYA
jgi:hypothetical protein